MRLEAKKAIIVGAGQTEGDAIGNGRAAALLFARQGAKVMCVDQNIDSARETVALIRKEGGNAFAHEANIAISSNCKDLVIEAENRMGKIDILHNNVGIGSNDSLPHLLDEKDFDRIF